jgi:hypothetical protein
MKISYQLEYRLLERFARIDGVCPVRNEIYEEAFDELIR